MPEVFIFKKCWQKEFLFSSISWNKEMDGYRLMPRNSLKWVISSIYTTKMPIYFFNVASSLSSVVHWVFLYPLPPQNEQTLHFKQIPISSLWVHQVTNKLSLLPCRPRYPPEDEYFYSLLAIELLKNHVTYFC